MGFKNTSTSYGLVAKLLHWCLAAALWGMFLFGRSIASMKPALDNIHLYGWHKSIGILLLTLILFRLLWRIISPPPKIIIESTTPKAQIYLAHGVHFSLYILMLVTPLLGWLASSATGFEMRFFGSFKIPPIIPEDPAIEELLFSLHGLSATLLVALSVLHLCAALYRHFIKKDDTLRRMIR
ncbi:MAG: cytochrome b [Proteobacteria bacterium]|nr:cytochrome b [Pseudomonadota bacterium]